MLVHVKGIANYGQGGQLFVLERNMFKPQYRYLIDEMERVSKATMKMIEMYAPVFAKKEGIWVGKNALGIPYSVPMTNLSDMMLKPIYKNGEIVKWVVVPIEENIGMGLFYPYEKQLARKGREGESVDPILINLAKVGAKYRELIIKKMKEYNQNEPSARMGIVSLLDSCGRFLFWCLVLLQRWVIRWFGKRPLRSLVSGR